MCGGIIGSPKEVASQEGPHYVHTFISQECYAASLLDATTLSLLDEFWVASLNHDHMGVFLQRPLDACQCSQLRD